MASGIRQLSWSAAEVLALGTKAARGAGAPPLQAARFGQVAALHLMNGREEALLAAALDHLPDGPILTHPLALDRAVIALAEGEVAELTNVSFDALLLSYLDTLPFEVVAKKSESGAIHLDGDLTVPRAPPTLSRISGCDALMDQFHRLAARTLVPESDLSRSSGAGAGLSDND